MKRKKRFYYIYFPAFLILLILWSTGLSVRVVQPVTGASVVATAEFGLKAFLEFAALLLLFSGAVIVQMHPRPWLRYSILIFSIIFLGFYKKVMLTTSYILRLVTGRWWMWQGHIFLYILLILIFLITLLGRDTYCNYCCPFGAIQQILYKISPFKLKVSGHIACRIRNIRYVVLWLVLAATFAGGSLAVSVIDPYNTAFSLKGDWLRWLQLGLILIPSLLYYRIWCFYVCPVGALLHIIGKLPRFKKAFFGQNGMREKIRKENMPKSKTTVYIFFIILLLLLLISLSIVVLNLNGKVKPSNIDKPVVYKRKKMEKPRKKNSVLPKPAEEKLKRSTEAEKFFKKYGIKPREAYYYGFSN